MSIAAVLASLCRFVERSPRVEQIYIARSSERQVGEVFGIWPYFESDEKNDSSVVKPLPWWAQKVTEFFKKLDVVIDKEKTSQAKLSVSRSIVYKVPWNHLDQNQLAVFRNGPT